VNRALQIKDHFSR